MPTKSYENVDILVIHNLTGTVDARGRVMRVDMMVDKKGKSYNYIVQSPTMCQYLPAKSYNIVVLDAADAAPGKVVQSNDYI